jgi:diguanylate cyclase (GGDEF)-like protein
MADLEYRALEYIWKLLKEEQVPELDGDLAKIPRLQGIQHEIKALRELEDSLRDEINLRTLSMAALQERESRFRYLASHDPLTNALNRRSFMERMELELKTSQALGVPCGIVMIDLDHFKIFNDTWGHQAGDEALRHVVAIVTSLLRKNDFLCRYGGEEFVFFSGQADRNTGISIAERMREAIAGSPIQLESALVPITASFGVCIADYAAGIEEISPEALIHNADIALYRAKAEGRNCVVCFDFNPVRN